MITQYSINKNMADIHREIADKYQGLFNLMSKEHGLILTISEMDEIILEAQKVVRKFDADGC